MRVSAGLISEIDDSQCVAITDDAIVVRVGDEVHAFRNQCVHQEAPLEGGWVRDGILTCPLHFWRYQVNDGTHLASNRCLESFPVEIIDDEVFVLIPDDDPPRSLREQLLGRARSYDRTTEFNRRKDAP